MSFRRVENDDLGEGETCRMRVLINMSNAAAATDDATTEWIDLALMADRAAEKEKSI